LNKVSKRLLLSISNEGIWFEKIYQTTCRGQKVPFWQFLIKGWGMALAYNTCPLKKSS
jgi:hypothetical protein